MRHDVPSPVPCPVCGSGDVTVLEDVSDEATVYRCAACDQTWAQRWDVPPAADRTATVER